jgi:hypothetical protein
MQAAGEAAGDPFAALPTALALSIFALVPPAERLACASVCRAWRATLDDAAAWLHLDLDVRCDDNADYDGSATASLSAVPQLALLRRAAARAAGGLRTLRLACGGDAGDALRAVVAANAASLRQVSLFSRWAEHGHTACALEALLAASPLRLLEADVLCARGSQAVSVLRNEAPFGPLRIRSLVVYCRSVSALAPALAAHASLRSVSLTGASLATPADALPLDAIVDAALSLRLPRLALRDCALAPCGAPALARLLAGGALTELCIMSSTDDDLQNGFVAHALLDAPAAAVLGAALRANGSLTSLSLNAVGLFRAAGGGDGAAAAALLSALLAHSSLRALDLSWNRARPDDVGNASVARALGALVAEDARALQALRLRGCRLGDAVLGPLVDALARNTHLRVLELSGNGLSGEFMSSRLLAAVRANASLRALSACGELHACEAEALVRARA